MTIRYKVNIYQLIRAGEIDFVNLKSAMWQLCAKYIIRENYMYNHFQITQNSFVVY